MKTRKMDMGFIKSLGGFMLLAMVLIMSEGKEAQEPMKTGELCEIHVDC